MDHVPVARGDLQGHTNLEVTSHQAKPIKKNLGYQDVMMFLDYLRGLGLHSLHATLTTQGGGAARKHLPVTPELRCRLHYTDREHTVETTSFHTFLNYVTLRCLMRRKAI